MPAPYGATGLAYTAGVMIAFGALVGVLLGFRAGGDAVGWGFQLQAPAFVVVLAYVIARDRTEFVQRVYNIRGHQRRPKLDDAQRPHRRFLHGHARGCRCDSLYGAVHGARLSVLP